jgi:hypothetical protein
MAQVVPKNRTPCKKWWRDSQNPIHKKEKRKKKKTPTIIPKKQTVQPGVAFEDIAFKPEFDIVKF